LKHYVADPQKDWDAYVGPLTYAYNLQVNRSTGTAPFNLVLSRIPPSAVIAARATAHPADGPQTPTTAQAKRSILRRYESALSLAKERLTATQRRCKRDFDRKVMEGPHLKEGDEVFLDKPEGNSDEPPDVTRKLAPTTSGPFKVLATDRDTVAIEVNGLRDVVCRDRVTKVPTPSLPGIPATPPHGHRAEIPHSTTSGATAPRDTGIRITAIGEPILDAPDAIMTPEGDILYAVDHIVSHRRTPAGVLYRVRWYGYTSKDDTEEPPEHIPENFLRRYQANLARKRLST